MLKHTGNVLLCFIKIESRTKLYMSYRYLGIIESEAFLKSVNIHYTMFIQYQRPLAHNTLRIIRVTYIYYINLHLFSIQCFIASDIADSRLDRSNMKTFFADDVNHEQFVF